MNRRRWAVVGAVVAIAVLAVMVSMSEHNRKAEDERRGDRLYCQLVGDPYEHAPASGDLCMTVLTGGDQ
jgi:hypothetical protein